MTDLFTIPKIELSYVSPANNGKRPIIKSSLEASKVFLSTWNQGTLELKEALRVMLLSKCNRLLGIYDASIGDSTSVVVDFRNIFSAAILANASSIIIAHNHPSGNLEPSEADKTVYNKLMEAARYMDVKVLDFLIVTKSNYYSFVDNNWMQYNWTYDTTIDFDVEKLKQSLSFKKNGGNVVKHLHDLVPLIKANWWMRKGFSRSIKVSQYTRPSRAKLKTISETNKTCKIGLMGHWLKKAGFEKCERVEVIPLNDMLIIVPERK